MGLAACGLAACDKIGGGTGTSAVDPEAIVSDKFEADEQWDKAMWDTFTYLFDFEGEDDPTKTYEEFPYWHPNVRYGIDAFDHDLKLAQDQNFKVDLFFDATVKEGGYERWNNSTAYDMGKYYSVYDYATEYYDGSESSMMKQAMKGEDYMRYSEEGKIKQVTRFTMAEGMSPETPLNVWSNHSSMSSIGNLSAWISPWFDLSHFGLLKDKGISYFENHPSILEFAKYDEEKGAYVIKDKNFSDNGLETIEGTTYTFKFKDGMLVAVWFEQTVETMTTKRGITITYGGQNVTFPNDLPW